MSDKDIITEICSVLQYEEDHGDFEHIKRVLTHVRYTNRKVGSFFVRGRDGVRYEISIAPAPAKPKATKPKGGKVTP